MKATERIYRTRDGRLVKEGHLDAAFLAYPPGSQIPADEARANGLLDDEQAAPRRPAKNRTRHQDKSAAKPADKAKE